MPSVQSIEQDFKSQLTTLGRAGMNAIFPKDIEAYVVAIELVDSNGNTVDFFSWPILPNEIRESHPEITNIKKTIGGVYVLKNSSFTPRAISMKGDFGRRFKILLGGNKISLAGFSASISSGQFKITPPNLLGQEIPQFSSFAKTGYGCIKVIEAIKDKSKELDSNNKPYSLYFYNPILGNNYQVEINNFDHAQDSGAHNMVPAYSLQMTAVAPLDSVLSRTQNIKSAIKNLTLSNLQKKATSVAHSLRSINSISNLF